MLHELGYENLQKLSTQQGVTRAMPIKRGYFRRKEESM